MSTVFASGSQTAVINTEHSVAIASVAGVFTFMVDATNMALGDVLELMVKVAYEQGGTRRVTHQTIFAHVQGDPGKISVPVVSPYSAEFIIKQTAGTGRSFPWVVVQV